LVHNDNAESGGISGGIPPHRTTPKTKKKKWAGDHKNVKPMLVGNESVGGVWGSGEDALGESRNVGGKSSGGRKLEGIGPSPGILRNGVGGPRE